MVQKLPNAAASVLTVGTTATAILDLIRTAASDTSYNFVSGVNAVHVFVETQAIRWLDDGNTPTATVGHKASAGSVLSFEGVDFRKLMFIRDTGAGGDAQITIRVGFANIRG